MNATLDQPGASVPQPKAFAIVVAMLVAVALLSCTQWGFDAASLIKSSASNDVAQVKSAVPKLRLTGADIMLWLAFAIWALHTVLERRWEWLKALPVPAVLLIAWTILSLSARLKGEASAELTMAQYRRDGIKEFVQFVEFFAVAYLMYAWAARRKEALKWIMMASMGGATIAVVWAWAQYLMPSSKLTAMQVGAGFDDRNVLGAYLALTIPLLVGYGLWSSSRLMLVWALALAAGALCVTLAGGQYVAMSVGILIVMYLWRPYGMAVAALAVILAFAWLFPHLPRKNNEILLDSVALYRTEDLSGSIQLAKLSDVRKMAKETDPEYGNMYEAYSWPWQQRWKEWQAAGNMICAFPLFGVGAGGYQNNVNMFCNKGMAIPKFPRNLMEPNALSTYTVLGASLGLPALLFLFWLTLRSLVGAVTGLKRALEPWRGVAAGCIGALTAFAIAGIFTNFLVRGVGITLAVVLALGATVGSLARQEKD
jgi:hypothetical protein